MVRSLKIYVFSTILGLNSISVGKGAFISNLHPRQKIRSTRGADKSLARHTSRCILFDGENISFDGSLIIYMYVCIYIYSTNIPPIMIINRIYEHQNLLSL
jgi:hypothetical protein